MYIKLSETAKRLGVSYSTLFREVERGKLPAYKFANCLQVSEEDLAAYIEASRVTPAPTASKSSPGPVWMPGMKIKA